ncbi:MAG TPA: VOC family protein [Candidatus Saccharimonadales bacterium]|nr:VOC family protein [Candidatus Saccharimonadales bacterium]
MLGNVPVCPTLPSTDLQRSRKFYTEMLGLSVKKELSGAISFSAGNGTEINLYKRGPSKADHTVAAFRVTNLEETIDELISKGIVFEQYDFPGLKTDEKGIAEISAEGERGAWFKDPDGNILAIGQEL